MAFGIMYAAADKEIVFVVISFDFGDLCRFDFAGIIGVRAVIVAVSRIGSKAVLEKLTPPVYWSLAAWVCVYLSEGLRLSRGA